MAVLLGTVLVAAFVLHSPVVAQSANLDARLNGAYAAIDRALESSSMPGLVVGITDRERLKKVIVHGYSDLKARTPLTADSRFALGSVSKSFTAVALMQLADEGRFDPAVPITRYLPWFSTKSRFAPITGHDLMTHTSGLPSYLVDASSSRFAAVELRDFDPPYAPGEHWWYSNTGYQILGYVLEDIERAPYRAIIQRRVLNALGMTSSTAVVDNAERSRLPVSYQRWPYDGKYVEASWFEYAAGDGSIVSNATDMCAYVRFLLNRGAIPHGRLLSERRFAELTTPVLNNYAYGLAVLKGDGGMVIMHPGSIGGFKSLIEAHMEEGFGLVFLSNGGIDSGLKAWIVEAITAAYRGLPLPDAPTISPNPEIVDIQQYVGVYHPADAASPDADDTVTIVAVDDRLWLKRRNAITALERMGTDNYRTASPDGDEYPYFFGREGGRTSGKVIEVSHGPRWYVADGFGGVVPRVAPPDYSAYVGHFENHDPEGPEARVFISNGRLMIAVLGNVPPGMLAQPLEPVGDAVFRIGDPPYNPERARFDTVIEGHALRLSLSGVPLYRMDTP